MPVTKIGDIFDAMRTAFLAESDLTDLLGSSDAMYREFPHIKVTYPILVFDMTSLAPQTQISGAGLYRPDVQLDIMVKNPYDAEDIFGVLEEKFSIPNERTATINSSNHVIDQMVWDDVFEVAQLRVVDTDERIRQFTSLFSLRIRR